MGFKGVVISDDLRMKAISKKYSMSEASLLSLQAGVDIILICQGGEEGGDILQKMEKEMAFNSALKKQVHESLSRISQLRIKYLK